MISSASYMSMSRAFGFCNSSILYMLPHPHGDASLCLIQQRLTFPKMEGIGTSSVFLPDQGTCNACCQRRDRSLLQSLMSAASGVWPDGSSRGSGWLPAGSGSSKLSGGRRSASDPYVHTRATGSRTCRNVTLARCMQWRMDWWARR